MQRETIAARVMAFSYTRVPHRASLAWRRRDRPFDFPASPWPCRTMRPSHRITHLTDDAAGGWGIHFRARALKEAGARIADLTIGEHDVRTHPDILDAMHRAALGGHTGYSAISGTAALRKAVAQRVAARTGVPTAPENVLITPGGQAAL